MCPDEGVNTNGCCGESVGNEQDFLEDGVAFYNGGFDVQHFHAVAALHGLHAQHEVGGTGHTVHEQRFHRHFFRVDRGHGGHLTRAADGNANVVVIRMGERGVTTIDTKLHIIRVAVGRVDGELQVEGRVHFNSANRVLAEKLIKSVFVECLAGDAVRRTEVLPTVGFHVVRPSLRLSVERAVADFILVRRTDDKDGRGGAVAAVAARHRLGLGISAGLAHCEAVSCHLCGVKHIVLGAARETNIAAIRTSITIAANHPIGTRAIIVEGLVVAPRGTRAVERIRPIPRVGLVQHHHQKVVGAVIVESLVQDKLVPALVGAVQFPVIHQGHGGRRHPVVTSAERILGGVGQIDFHIGLACGRSGGSVVEGDGVDGAGLSQFRRRENLLRAGVVVVVAQRVIGACAVLRADDTVRALGRVRDEDIRAAHSVELHRRGVDVQGHEAVAAEFGGHAQHEIAVHLVGGVDDDTGIVGGEGYLAVRDRDGDVLVFGVGNHRGLLFQTEMEVVGEMVFRHDGQVVEGHRVDLGALHGLLPVVLIDSGDGSRQEGGVERKEVVLGHDGTDGVTVEVLAVAHDLEQQGDGGVAAVDGVGGAAEGVVAVGHLGDVEIGEEAALLGVVGLGALADDFVEGVGVVLLVHYNGAGEGQRVLPEDHHGVVGGGGLRAHLQAAGLGAVGEIRVHPEGLGLVAEVTDGADIVFHIRFLIIIQISSSVNSNVI